MWSAKIAASTAVSPTIEPIERSMFPVMMRIAVPTPTSPTNAALSASTRMLLALQKRWLCSPVTTKMAISANATPKLCREPAANLARRARIPSGSSPGRTSTAPDSTALIVRPRRRFPTGLLPTNEWPRARALPVLARNELPRVGRGAQGGNRRFHPCERAEGERSSSLSPGADPAGDVPDDLARVRLDRGRIEHDPAEPQHHDAVGDVEDVLDVVADDHDAEPLARDRADHLERRFGLVHAQGGSRLVEHQQPLR